MAQATAEAQGKNEKSGSKGLTRVNMCVTSSLKVCQQTDQADKPDVKAQSHKQGGRSAAQPQLCLTLPALKKSIVQFTPTLLIEGLSYRVNTALNNSRINYVCVHVC